jgi:peptide chain release factor 1
MHKQRRLLFTITRKDFRITYFSGSGGGGQHRNKHKNCVRIQHKASGAMAIGQSHRERKANMREALHNLVKTGTFKVWHARVTHELLTGKSIDELVDEAMAPKNLKIEGRDENGRWAEIEE